MRAGSISVTPSGFKPPIPSRSQGAHEASDLGLCWVTPSGWQSIQGHQLRGSIASAHEQRFPSLALQACVIRAATAPNVVNISSLVLDCDISKCIQLLKAGVGSAAVFPQKCVRFFTRCPMSTSPCHKVSTVQSGGCMSVREICRCVESADRACPPRG